MKYVVDKYNLENGVYAGGNDIEGGLAIRVVCYLRFVVALWWFAMGALSCAISIFDPHGILVLPEKLWLQRGGLTLIVSGVITFGCSWWRKMQQLHRLRLHGPAHNPQPTIWEDIGEALLLTEHRQRSSADLSPRQRSGMDGSNSSSVLDPSLSSLSAKFRMKQGELLSWDGTRLLG